MRAISSFVCLAVLAVASPAMAQGTAGEFAVSFTGAATDLELVTGNIEYDPSGVMVEGAWFLNERLGFTGELSYETGSNILLTADTTTALGGVRFRFPNDSFVTPSIRVAAGLGHVSLSLLGVEIDSVSGAAVVFGGLFDFNVTQHLAIRVQPDVMWFEQFDPIMFRFGIGMSYAFGREFTPRSTLAPRQVAPVAAAPGQVAAGAVPIAAPAQQQPVEPSATARIAAGTIPAGTTPPEKVAESAGWTSVTATGVGYKWSVTVRNNDTIPHTASVTAALYDAEGTALVTSSSELLEVAPGVSIVLGGVGNVSRELAQRGDYWTTTVRWIGVGTER